MRNIAFAAALIAASVLATPAAAELAKIDSERDFVSLIDGKTLTRPLVKLQVKPAGTISGRGMTWDVTGNWSWQNGYFCREMDWGGYEISYNCQEVRAQGNTIRFTSDRGAGEFADFRLR